MKIKKTVSIYFDRPKLRLDQSKIVSDVFLIRIFNSALSVLIGFGFLIYPKYIRDTLVTFLCCLYCGLCESLVRSLRRFSSHKLRVFKEKISTPWWSIQLLPLKLKETQAGVLVFGGESKKEGVRGFGACTWLCQ